MNTKQASGKHTSLYYDYIILGEETIKFFFSRPNVVVRGAVRYAHLLRYFGIRKALPPEDEGIAVFVM